jgi:hypothetical protein
VDLMVDAVQGEAGPPSPSGDRRTDLAGVARHVRATLLRHPWLGPELTGRPALGANSLRQYDAALTAAAALTPDVSLAANAVDTLLAFVHGAVARELTEEQWQASVGPYIRDVIASGAYPQFARRVLDAEDASPAQRFDFGLACVLDGLAARVRRSDPASLEAGDGAGE